MNKIERLIRRARVKMKIIASGRLYQPPKSETFDEYCIGTNRIYGIGIRYGTTILSVFDESACVVVTDYEDETRRTIDSCLDYEKDEEWNWQS